MPVATTAELQYVLGRDDADVLVVALEPRITLLPDPGNVVTAVARPALMCQHRLESVVATVVRAQICRESIENQCFSLALLINACV